MFGYDVLMSSILTTGGYNHQVVSETYKTYDIICEQPLVGAGVCSRGHGVGGHLRVGVVVEAGAATPDGEHTAHTNTMKFKDACM